MDSVDHNRLKKISSNLSEEDRRKELGNAEEKRRDIERIIGTDVVNHDKLVDITRRIWEAVPNNQKSKYTAEDWQAAIQNYYTNALAKAENKLSESVNSNNDEKMFLAKVKILRQTFAKQVIRAMHEVSAEYKR